MPHEYGNMDDSLVIGDRLRDNIRDNPKRDAEDALAGSRASTTTKDRELWNQF